MTDHTDLAVIGGGPGGYPAAIRASQLGLQVTLIERDKLGGECTNYGCVPTKALLKPLETIHQAQTLPFTRGQLEIDFQPYMEWARTIADKTRQGVEYLLKGYGITTIHAEARLETPDTILLSTGEEIKAKKIILAPGTSPATIPGVKVDGRIVHNNRTILSLHRKPESILIIGGGYIGVEYATITSLLGIKTTIVEMLPTILPNADPDLAKTATRQLRRAKVEIHTNTRLEKLETHNDHAEAKLSNGKTIQADTVLIAVGRKPNTANLGLEKANVKTDQKGYIITNQKMQTTNPDIYATGDATGPPLLAHKAFLQAVIAAENAVGHTTTYNPQAVPAVIYTTPELASTGLTLQQARQKGIPATEQRYPIASLPMARILGQTQGTAKIVYNTQTHQILGAHIAAPHASEIITTLTLAIEYGATLEDITLTIHPHPTIAEAIRETAELALQKPIHYLLKK